MTTGAAQIAAIHTGLLHGGLDLSPTGVPRTPLIVVELDDLAVAGRATIARAAALLRESLPLTVGLLRRPLTAAVEPLLDALTMTLGDVRVRTGTPEDCLSREVVPVLDVDAALQQLRAAVAHAPQAALACEHLLRRTSTVDTTSALAAEAAVYSMLLGGSEFARWSNERDATRRARTPERGPLRPGRSDPGDDLVRMRREASTLTIMLNHPSRRNALSVRLREELLAALAVAESDSGIDAVEFTGAGPAFCSGGDLAEFGAATDPVAAYLVRLDRAPWRVLDRISGRLTARVHGACIGAGAEMAAFAGEVVAAPDTWFRFPEVAMGLIPGAGGTVSVPRRIGRWRAAWLMMSGARLSAPEALRWGLVDQVTGTPG
ncbi:enoyl-CoA hydratase/isomerase family protein [Nocardia sp. NPDC050712]|uniref:enoyl-CoA hydratase/isomerase family protein n=1 Tax=Nocardia sp. NPDC050712 TaxID=3155518 RepID=UPI00340DFC15